MLTINADAEGGDIEFVKQFSTSLFFLRTWTCGDMEYWPKSHAIQVGIKVNLRNDCELLVLNVQFFFYMCVWPWPVPILGDTYDKQRSPSNRRNYTVSPKPISLDDFKSSNLRGWVEVRQMWTICVNSDHCHANLICRHTINNELFQYRALK